MTGAACVSKERVPASLRIRPKSPRNHVQLISSRFGARCGRAGRRSHVSYDGRSVRFQRARARFPAHPAEKSPESCAVHFFPVRGAMRTRRAAVARLLMTDAAYVSKERVPASLRIRMSEALAKAGRAFFLSESSRDPRPDPQATVGGIPVPVIKIARKPETPKAGRPIVCDRTGNCSGRLAKQLARGGTCPPRSSGKRRRAELVEIWLYKFCALWYT